MNNQLALFILLAAGIIMANLPFFNERLFLLKALPGNNKNIAWRLLELLTYYFLFGFFARFIEARVGSTVYPQGWEFYAVTTCLFLVFAYPGYVMRYLWPNSKRNLP